jgi:hypothetical protein
MWAYLNQLVRRCIRREKSGDRDKAEYAGHYVTTTDLQQLLSKAWVRRLCYVSVDCDYFLISY